MDIEDNLELDDDDYDNIDKDIEEEQTMSQEGLKFNKTFKGGLNH